MTTERPHEGITSPSISHWLREAYTTIYSSGDIPDSPDHSRLLMAQLIAKYLVSSQVEPTTILDLGAGNQNVEKTLQMLSYSAAGRGKYAKLKGKLATTQVVALDIASCPIKRKPYWTKPLESDSAAIPLRNESVDLVVSNHSVDMLRRNPDDFNTALGEVHRVLRPGGSVILNLHHASLYNNLCEFFQARNPASPSAQYYNPNAHNPFFEDALSIENELARVALLTQSVNLEKDNYDNWWCVTAQKAPTSN
jgi:ubiquinone/menaquinone biosynthesis C-methylase UbiE